MLQELEEILLYVLKYQGELHESSVILVIVHKQINQPEKS